MDQEQVNENIADALNIKDTGEAIDDLYKGQSQHSLYLTPDEVSRVIDYMDYNTDLIQNTTDNKGIS